MQTVVTQAFGRKERPVIAWGKAVKACPEVRREKTVNQRAANEKNSEAKENRIEEERGNG